MAYLSVRPAKGNITEAFGLRPKPTPTSPATHYGQDYGWGGGLTVVAARAGRAVSTSYSGAYGNRVILDHGDGVQTWYCHLDEITVSVGDKVPAGRQVGVMGSTGNVTARHLHFELRINGVAVDPAPYFTGLAGLNGIPIQEEPTRTVRARNEKSMLAIMINDGLGKLGPKGQLHTYVFGPGLFLETTGNDKTANLVSVILNGVDSKGEYFATPNLTYTELYRYAKASRALSESELAPYKAAAA